MESSSPMDRLLSGDVGFGKTEIAFNAMYKAMLGGKQTALISPLVVLAYEHFDKAQERFKNFPFNIEVITRFEKESKIKETLKKLHTGKIDAIIGTHRLLSEDIQFKDL
jgi:transcription-repair coupling factor (superfamily II helicase)